MTAIIQFYDNGEEVFPQTLQEKLELCQMARYTASFVLDSDLPEMRQAARDKLDYINRCAAALLKEATT